MKNMLVPFLLLLLGVMGSVASADVGSIQAPIINGSPADRGEYPFMVSLAIGGPNGGVSCGGSLVAPRFVLTAAHCVTNTSRQRAVSQPGDITATIGRTNLLDSTEGERRAVAEVLVHPRYNTEGGSFDNDVAVLRLTGPSTLRPVELASPQGPSDRALWLPGARATIIGYGVTCATCAGTSSLQEGEMTVVSDGSADDAWSFRQFPDFWHTTHKFRAEYMVGAKGNERTCYGDSGGPILVSAPDGSWRQFGVTSWGPEDCKTSRPTVFARVGDTTLHRWIRTVIHETPLVADVNGDGRADIVTVVHGEQLVWVALSNGVTFDPSMVWHAWWSGYGQLAMLADVNGDGRADLLAFDDTHVWVACSTGMGFENAFDQKGGWDRNDTLRMGDVNGDGRADIVIFTQDSSADVYVMLSTGVGFLKRQQWHGGFGRDGETVAVGDINGDGMADIVRFTQDMNGAVVWAALSDGRRFDPARLWYDTVFAPTTEHPLLADVTGDGLADIVTFTRNSRTEVWVAPSSSTFFSPWLTSRWHDAFGDAYDQVALGDVNGDGLADAIRFTQDSYGDVFVALAELAPNLPTWRRGYKFGVSYLAHDWFAP